MALREYLVGEVAEDHADGLLTRREALRRLGLFGLSLPAAAALLAACGGDDDAATTTTSTSAAPTSSTTAAALVVETIAIASLTAAYAAPAGEAQAAVLVIHENRGLTPHFYDLVGRFAAEGMAALCVDLASAGESEGTAGMDEGEVQAALGAAPLEALLGDLRSGIDELQRRAPGVPVVVVGFCFGGGMTWQLLAAGESRIDVAIPFYGPAPADADFSGSHAAVLGVYAGLDDRVNASRDAAAAALEAAGLTHEIRTFDGVGHAFFNDTGQRYDAAAAEEAWQLMLDWIADHFRQR